MKRKFTYFFIVTAFFTVAGISGIQYSSQPPQGHTGADGSNCTNCHGGFPVNSPGGNVTVSGLPTSGYIPSQAYNFSLTITHSAANRLRWGFAIVARNAAGQNIGTFSSTNPNAAINGAELTHNNAVSTSAQASYTYTNLKWTAPPSPGTNDNIVTFYYAGNAANGGSSSGDYIYTGTTQIVLPITLASFDAVVKNSGVSLIWKTNSESNSDYFEIEKSDDQFHFVPTGKVAASGNSTEVKTYSFLDNKAVFYDKPVYYRLALVDKDGKKKYSNVINVILKGAGTYVKRIYPNAITAGNDLHVSMVSDKEEVVSIEVYSYSGKKIRQVQRTITSGQNDLLISINKLTAPGLYSVVVKSESNTQQIPLIVQ